MFVTCCDYWPKMWGKSSLSGKKVILIQCLILFIKSEKSNHWSGHFYCMRKCHQSALNLKQVTSIIYNL